MAIQQMLCPATVLAYNSVLGTWQSGSVDLLGHKSTLDEVCYIFLENGIWYKGENIPDRELDRRKILAPFKVPDFLSSQLCTDHNGYFGSKSSVKTISATANSEEKKEQLETLATWFRILTKKLLNDDEIVQFNQIRPQEDKDKDYFWYEMGFFTQWSGSNACRILCIGTPPEVRERLSNLLLANPKLELQDPFAMVRLLLDEVIKCCDDNTWRITKKVRAVEKARKEKPSFEELQNLLRHTNHMIEVETVTIDSLECLAKLQDSHFKILSDSLTKTYQNQAKEYLAFQLQMMKSLKRRAQATHERLQSEITLAFNLIASLDNQIMKSITLLTMVFLPATFVSALFSTPFFADNGLQFSRRFWIYWIVIIPLTTIVIIVWWWWLGGSYNTMRKRWLQMQKK